MTQQPWYILGAGAIGILYASWLTKQSYLIVKPDSVLAEHALPKALPFLIEKNTQTRTANITCVLASQCKKIEKLLICTKAHQTQAAVNMLDIADNATLVLMQNGMGNAQWLGKRFPNTNLVHATTTHGAYRVSPNHVVHAGEGETFIGFLDSNKNKQTTLNHIVESLNNTHEHFQIDTDMHKRLWLKLAINCAINPLTVIYQCKNGALLDNGEREQHLEKLCREIDAILLHKGLLMAGQSCVDTVKGVAKATAQNFSSMYQDAKHQRHSEIDFIQGYLCDEAKHLNIAVPENIAVYHTIKKFEARY